MRYPVIEKTIEIKASIENVRRVFTDAITYKVQENAGTTTLHAKEKFNYEMAADQFQEASQEWDSALQSVKKIAENLP